MPNAIQLKGLYRLSYWLMYMMFQPIHLVCIDQRTKNLFILAGSEEDLEFQITITGEVF
ncbi:DUF6888 family protein [Dactylococcopsis salina]|uniref:DUF6888 domain-containing protein n=1 Tax=Dactylococcopsis salina (strain PCC 8305) TaxID=13035 RepID=K9YZ27_DACS8|nr:hypothetical protein Dacsa_3211 [Dactylococcopsis salina PCC 8305]